MRHELLIAIAACQPPAPPVIANAATASLDRQRVPFAPCPRETEGVIDHELFRGCAPAPYHEPIAPCPHGECPRPCRVQLVGGGTQSVHYDDRGRMIRAEGNEDRLLDTACTYAGDRVDTCHLLYEGRETTAEKAWRDRSGHIIGTSNGDDMGDVRNVAYRYDAAGDVIASSSEGAFVYDARKRLVSVGKATFTWDDRDRLIRSTVGDASYVYTYECR